MSKEQTIEQSPIAIGRCGELIVIECGQFKMFLTVENSRQVCHGLQLVQEDILKDRLTIREGKTYTPIIGRG